MSHPGAESRREHYALPYQPSPSAVDIPIIASSWSEHRKCNRLNLSGSKNEIRHKVNVDQTIDIAEDRKQNVTNITALEKKAIGLISIRGKLTRQRQWWNVADRTKW